MTKHPRGSRMPPLALPICLLGANVEGKPNYCTIAWFTMIDDEPPTIGLVTGKDRKTKDGIIENRTFSVNLPSADMAVPVDYVGITSGREEDKSAVFRSFYGKLKTAPMVEECPVTMECELKRIVELEGTDLIIGEIVEVYAEERVYHGDEPDPLVLDPLMYLSSAAAYHRLGERTADAFKVGKSYKKAV
jgi:flavin reductase (DIM6/NTAB) family NADH-FMN oxidoreductase RutF